MQSISFARFLQGFLLLFATISVISCSPVRKMQGSDDVIKWEKDISDFARLDSLEKDPEHAVLFTGSSSIRLWKTIREDMAPFPVIQRGYGGARIEDFAFYLKKVVFPHQFRALVLFVGTNNLTGGGQDFKPEEIARYARYINRTVRSKYPDTPIFWIAITPTNSRWKVWDKIQETNTLIQKICNRSRDMYFIETANGYLGPDGLPRKELFVEDQLHQNREGYRIWAEIIKTALSRALKPIP